MSQSSLLLNPRQPRIEFRNTCALAVMAKAPVAGKVKTRLTPPLTSEQAAGLSACFLRDTMCNLVKAASATAARWVLSYTPASEESAFEGILPPGTLLLPQRGNGFGDRLLRTAEDLFSCGFAAVCLIDSDSPTVPTSIFVRAAEELQAAEDRAVLGGSDDGGYYLLGLKRPHKDLFDGIAWSTAAVAQQTRRRAERLGLSLTELPCWYDVDDAQSLDRLRRELFLCGPGPFLDGGAYPALATRAYLEQIGLSLDGSAALIPGEAELEDVES